MGELVPLSNLTALMDRVLNQLREGRTAGSIDDYVRDLAFEGFIFGKLGFTEMKRAERNHLRHVSFRLLSRQAFQYAGDCLNLILCVVS
jgi:hypothetical protein